VNPAGLLRADPLERAATWRVLERAAYYRGELDKSLARLIRNELADMENRRKRR
jgi:hypothetical protein